MKRVVFLIIIIHFSWLTWTQQNYKTSLKLMGSAFEITVVAKNQVKADEYFKLAIDEITRVETLISSWKEDSQTTKINNNAGIRPVKVEKELYELIKRSLFISELTEGAFDISFASMERIWKFDGSMPGLPTEKEIKHAIRLINYKHILLEPGDTSVFMKEKGMRIGFGAIGKGYAADCAKRVLIHHGVKGGLINASGDISAWGKQFNGDEWTVAITNPLNKQKAFAIMPLRSEAVVTSGNYEKFFEWKGKKYSQDRKSVV